MIASPLYNAALALLWITFAAAAFGIWKLAVTLRHRTRRERWAAWLLLGIIALLIVVNYSLAYPAAPQYLYGTPHGEMLDLFVPAEWLYDHTPLRGPILNAGEFWGSASRLEQNSQWRQRSFYWGRDPWLDILWWATFVAFVATGATFAVRKTRQRLRTMTGSHQ